MAESAGAPKDLIGFLDYYFVNKAPFQIPQAGREWLAQFGPWFVVVMLVLSLPAVLLLLGVGSTWPPVGFGGFRWNYFSTNGWGYTNVYWLWLIGVVVPFVLLALSLPGLFARKMSGWRLAFYAELINLIAGVVMLDIVGALIGGLIWFYVLFQIRPLYK
jgi:hypothetical protein